MNTTRAPLQEYLDTAYSPDREYVDGVVVERHVGERPHSLVLSNLIGAFGRRFQVWPTLRLRTGPTGTRVPDVCGVPNIWVVDPHRRKAYAYEDAALKEVTDALVTTDGAIS